MGTAAGRWVLVATVLGSSLAFLDGTVVNVALPAIGEDLDASFAGLQWAVNAYTLTLAGFLLLGGALGDRVGRRRVFLVGVVWFAIASLLCALAPNIETLIAARAVQGVGAALLTPASLALIEAGFAREDRGAAVGAWSGLGGVAIAIGPFLGGYLIDVASWRLIFLINLPVAAAVIYVTLRHVPETRGAPAVGRLDIRGTALAVLALSGLTYGLIQGPEDEWAAPVVAALAVGALLMMAFIAWEARVRNPLVPLSMFRSRQFSATNAVTFFVYGALTGGVFLVPVQLQVSLDYSALQAGASLVPMTAVMLVLSSRVGGLAQRFGARGFMTVGPIIAAAGMVWLSQVGPGSSYAVDVLPPILIFGFGLALTVAPLTSTVLAAAGDELAGTASAVNNDIARIAGLFAVAVIPVVAGISGDDYTDPRALTDGFEFALILSAALLAAGGLLAWATIRRGPRLKPEETYSCPLDAPPLRSSAQPDDGPEGTPAVVSSPSSGS
jgi:EmrB/QacA subfamily drug resistance transporter